MYERYLLESGLASQVGELKGKTLLCHCRRGVRCHGDILVEHADRKGDEEGKGGAEADIDDDGLPARLPPEAEEEDHEFDSSGPGWRGQGPPRRT